MSLKLRETRLLASSGYHRHEFHATSWREICTSEYCPAHVPLILLALTGWAQSPSSTLRESSASAVPPLLFRMLPLCRHSRMSQTRKFDRHASRGVFVCVSLLEFGCKIRFITKKSVISYFVYQNSRREMRTNTPRAALIQKWLRGIALSHMDLATSLALQPQDRNRTSLLFWVEYQRYENKTLNTKRGSEMLCWLKSKEVVESRFCISRKATVS